MQTIARNTKAFKNALSSAQDVRCFDLSNYFEGHSVNAGHLQTVADRAKLTKQNDGSYSLRVHSNLWYEFKVAQ